MVPFDQETADAAFDAIRRYGKGRGHPAQLNICDCAAYALAKARGATLLFKGQDFADRCCRGKVVDHLVSRFLMRLALPASRHLARIILDTLDTKFLRLNWKSYTLRLHTGRLQSNRVAVGKASISNNG